VFVVGAVVTPPTGAAPPRLRRAPTIAARLDVADVHGYAGR